MVNIDKELSMLYDEVVVNQVNIKSVCLCTEQPL